MVEGRLLDTSISSQNANSQDKKTRRLKPRWVRMGRDLLILPVTLRATKLEFLFMHNVITQTTIGRITRSDVPSRNSITSGMAKSMPLASVWGRIDRA